MNQLGRSSHAVRRETFEKMFANPTIPLGDRMIGRLGYGAMRITGPNIWGAPDDPAAVKSLLRLVVDRGVTLIDTADSYGPELSEELIRQALHPYPGDVVIATKAGYTRPGPPEAAWGLDGRPEYLKRCCEGSLRRLGVDHIDLFQLHVVDPDVPIEESVGALAELRDAGKIRHVGLCNVGVEELRRAQRVVPIASVQNRYNVVQRDSGDVLEECERAGVIFMPYSPLWDGHLTGPGEQGTGALLDVASRHGATPGQVSLAWLLARSPVTAPIPGTSSVRHFEENMAALGLELSEADMADLELVSAATPH
jgi:pyridoxine 4-dehydrogenase